MLYKKLAAGFVALLAIAVIGVWYGFQQFTEGMCGNAEEQTVLSPDGQLKAVMFERDCGATTQASLQVSVLRATQSLPDQGGNILVIDGPNSSTRRAAWVGTRTLQIQCPAQTRIFHQAAAAEVSLGLFRKTKVAVRYTKAAEYH